MNISFDPAYRQLAPHERAFVDELVLRVEKTSEQTGRDMRDVLADVQPSVMDNRAQAMLTRPLVTAAISDRVKELIEAQNISARRIVKEFAIIAFSAIDDFRVTDSLEFDLDQATPEQRRALSQIEHESTVNPRTGSTTNKLKLKMHDKIAALNALAKIRGLFNADGDPIDPEKWIAEGGVLINETAQEAASKYERFMNGE